MSAMISDEARLQQVGFLITSLEEGDHATADRLIRELGDTQSSEMFQKMGQLARRLHDALHNVQASESAGRDSDNDLKDARERLDFVVGKTAESSHRTLDAIEEMTPLTRSLESRVDDVASRWLSVQRRGMDDSEFIAMTRDLRDCFDGVKTDAAKISGGLTDVLLAQEYQDITGQVLREVISLVTDVEASLVEIIQSVPAPVAPAQGADENRKTDSKSAASRAYGPSIKSGSDVASSQDDVDELLSSLGF